MNLVILAAGMGSRFGGLKQLEPIDNNGNFIIDYSIYDAIQAGFDKVVFIIKEENLELFKNTVGKRIEKQIKVEYAFQNLNSYVPNEYLNIQRLKPWGTGHAILCAKDKVDKNFAVINADDFYGRDAIKQVYNFLKDEENKNDFALVAYGIANTLTENGCVKRGVCEIENGNLMGISESQIDVVKNKILKKPLTTMIPEEILPDTLVSVNLFGFTTKLFDYLQNGFEEFLNTNKKDLSACEYFITTILSNYISDKEGHIKVLKTKDNWYGLTYKDDYYKVSNGIKQLVEQGVYPKTLWKK